MSALQTELPEDDRLLTAKESADFVNLSIAAFWRNVCNRRLPPPVYPAPRAPRWWQSRLRDAVNRTEALPADAKAERRAVKLARLSAAAKEQPPDPPPQPVVAPDDGTGGATRWSGHRRRPKQQEPGAVE